MSFSYPKDLRILYNYVIYLLKLVELVETRHMTGGLYSTIQNIFYCLSVKLKVQLTLQKIWSYLINILPKSQISPHILFGFVIFLLYQTT